MSRLKQVSDIYEELDKVTTIGLKGNEGNIELQKIISLANISQSLRNIDITLAMLLDDKKGAGE